MGGHDHPTTGQSQRLGRFGSTLCYPAADVAGALILSIQPDEVDHVFACIEHVGVNLPDELPIK